MFAGVFDHIIDENRPSGPLNEAKAIAIGDLAISSEELPGLHNVSVLRETCVDGMDTVDPLVAGHEMCHILFDEKFHHGDLTNLYFVPTSEVERFDATKRLTDIQNEELARKRSPELLHRE
jgi:hypothetical protein